MTSIVQEPRGLRILIVGCGDIGNRAGELLAARGHEVTGMRRRIDALSPRIQPLAVDVLDHRGLEAISTVPYDVVIYMVSAAAFDEVSYRRAYVEGVNNIVSKIAAKMKSVKRFIFVSSTAVYHQNDDSWVNEASSTLPQRFNGSIMLEGERIALATGIGTCVRFSGIYGPSRWGLIENVRRRGVSPATPRRYTNRIHAEDCAGVLGHLTTLIARNTGVASCYLASDSDPAPAHDVEAFIAERLGGKASVQFNAAQGARRPGSKRCCNLKILESGYEFSYPSYRTGYEKTVTEYLEQTGG